MSCLQRDAAVHIALRTYAELVIIARQNCVQKNACDRGNSQRREGDGRTRDFKCETAGEPETADKNDGCDNKVSAVCEVYTVLDNVTNTDCGNHSVKDETYAADDGSRHGADDACELGHEAEHYCVDSRDSDDRRIKYPGKLQDTGILAVCRVGGTAEAGGECGRETVTDQCTVGTRILEEVLAYCRGDRGSRVPSALSTSNS